MLAVEWIVSSAVYFSLPVIIPAVPFLFSRVRLESLECRGEMECQGRRENQGCLGKWYVPHRCWQGMCVCYSELQQEGEWQHSPDTWVTEELEMPQSCCTKPLWPSLPLCVWHWRPCGSGVVLHLSVQLDALVTLAQFG